MGCVAPGGKKDKIDSNHLQHMCKIVSSLLGFNTCLILLWIYVYVFVWLIMKKCAPQFTVLTVRIFSFLSLFFFKFLLGYKGANSSRFQRCSIGGETPSGLWNMRVYCFFVVLLDNFFPHYLVILGWCTYMYMKPSVCAHFYCTYTTYHRLQFLSVLWLGKVPLLCRQ